MAIINDELSNLRDAPRRIRKLEISDGKITVQEDLICISLNESQAIEQKVHLRDKIAAIHTGMLSEKTERRAHCYCIVNTSKKMLTGDSPLVVVKADKFTEVESSEHKQADDIVGEVVCYLRFEHMTGFSKFKQSTS